MYDAAKVIYVVCRRKNVTYDDVRSKCKRMDISVAKQIIIHILHYHYTFSCDKLADIVNLSPRRVKYANKTVSDRLKYDRAFRGEYNDILQEIKATR